MLQNYECEECGKSFTTLDSFRQHYVEKHYVISRKCPFCEYEGDEIIRHLFQSHEIDTKSLYNNKKDSIAMSEEESIDYEEPEIIEDEEPIEEEPEKRISCPAKCGAVFPSIKDMNLHVKESHPDIWRDWTRRRLESRKKSKEMKKRMIEIERTYEAPPPGPTLEEDPEYIIHMKGREGLNELKRKRLEQILDRYSGEVLKTWQKQIILDEWDMNPAIRDNPYHLLSVIVNDAGVTRENIAHAIVRNVFALEQQYAHLLRERGLPVISFEPRQQTMGMQVPVFPQQQAYPQTHYTQFPTAQTLPQYGTSIGIQQQPSGLPYPPTQEPPITRQELMSMVDNLMESRARRDRLSQLETEVQEQKRIIHEILATVKEFAEGGGLKPKIKSEDDIILRELRRLEEDLKRKDEKIEELKETMHKKELEELRSELKQTRQELAAIYKAIQHGELAVQKSSTYQSDSLRFAHDTVQTVLQNQPIRKMIRMLVGPGRPAEPMEPEMGEEVITELEEEGLVEKL